MLQNRSRTAPLSRLSSEKPASEHADLLKIYLEQLQREPVLPRDDLIKVAHIKDQADYSARSVLAGSAFIVSRSRELFGKFSVAGGASDAVDQPVLRTDQLSQLKNELRCFALETELLRVRFSIAQLSRKASECFSSTASNSVAGPSGSIEECRSLLDSYQKVASMLIEARAILRDSTVILRSVEELSALQDLLSGNSSQRCSVNEEQKVRSILAEYADIEQVSTNLAKLARLERTLGLSWERQSALDTLTTRLHELQSVAQSAVERDLGRSVCDAELMAMSRALRERVGTLGEEPEAAMSRIQQSEIYLVQKAEAISTMVRGNLKLVVKVARRFKGCGVPLLELIQSGNALLPHAADKYQVRTGHAFTTYASWWLRKGMYAELESRRSEASLMRLKAHQDSSYERGMGDEPNNRPDGFDHDEAAVSYNVEQDIDEQLDLAQALPKALGALSAAQLELVRLRYGLNETRTEMSAATIARLKQCSEAAVNKTLQRAREKIKNVLGNNQAVLAIVERLGG
jgi:RNA polymerase sigma factor (sigma-70 family)